MIEIGIDSTPKPFGIIAGAVMTRIAARPIADVMRKLESPDVDFDWFPIGEGDGWLHFAIEMDEIKQWVKYLSE